MTTSTLSRARELLRGPKVLLGLLPLALGLVLWQLLGDERSLSFPPPSTWIDSLRNLHDQGLLIGAVQMTLKTFSLSLVVATVFGVLLGVLIGGSAKADRALGPLLELIRVIPPPALVPVIAVLLGPSTSSGVTIVTLAIVWPILLSTATSLRQVPAVRREAAVSMGLSRTDTFFKVVAPSLIPGVLVGIRVAISVSLVVTLLADILGVGQGLGALISERQQSLDAPAVWGLLLLIGIFGFVLNGLLNVIERRLLRNHPS
ncbi:sulfonate transport system permease protein [Rhodococcus sp. 27YEA15]|uniref:ABC transporter permease n=1 Tax=Rhodococcus sp. 27YEA15 TaxID=3156259 RepID=UPI003C7E68E1